MRAISSDPPESRARRSMAIHDSGHAIVAIHYGLYMGPISCHPYDQTDPFILGMFAQPTQTMILDDAPAAHTKKAGQLLAGELAARICLGLPLDEIVQSDDDRHDFAKVIDKAIEAGIHEDDLFPWVEEQHQITCKFLSANRTSLLALANAVWRTVFSSPNFQ